MNKIVDKPMKIDLHIHSKISKHKDGILVSNNNIDNIEDLVYKLNHEEINICSLTDHDLFSFDYYKKLKSYEGNGHIKKVLPGVEFSVDFSDKELKSKRDVHVIAIFDDRDEEKLMKIEGILGDTKGESKILPCYDSENKFTERKFINILRDIDLDVILIAHQKSSPKGRKFTKNDLLSIGELSHELLFTCYFDALEFKNRNNEIFNKAFILERKLKNKAGFISGSDCHSWSHYPSYDDKKENEDVIFTYAKCLPTFKGLKMCFTDFERFSFEKDFFSKTNIGATFLEMSIQDMNYKIPLSQGINVVIGDNSVGKSMLLYELLDSSYKNALPKGKQKGYSSYCANNDIVVNSEILKENIFQFDEQGKIRDHFEKGNFKDKDFLNNFFKQGLDVSPYKTILQNELERMISSITRSIELSNLERNLGDIIFNWNDEGKNTFNLTECHGRKSMEGQYKKNVDWLTRLKSNIISRDDIVFTKLEIEKIDEFVKGTLDIMENKYSTLRKKETINDAAYAIFDSSITGLRKELNDLATNYQQLESKLNTGLMYMSENFISLVDKKLKNKEYKPNINTLKIVPVQFKKQKYNFITKAGINEISSAYFLGVYDKLFKKGNVIKPCQANVELLESSLSKYTKDETELITDYIKRKMIETFDNDLESIQIINTEQGKNIDKVLSAGMNQRMYFDIVSNETYQKGIYVVDQPEDGVSQSAINEYVLSDFKHMSKNRQILMVTHNAQFIVNLDVDNVIFIGKNENNNIFINSGALEYEDDEYSILDLITDNIEGGIDALRKRWKRYGKNY